MTDLRARGGGVVRTENKSGAIGHFEKECVLKTVICLCVT